MTRPLRPCLGCGHPVSPTGLCPHCGRVLDRRTKQQAHGRATARWKSTRLAVLERDRYVCRLQLAGCSVRASSVHLAPTRLGDHVGATVDDCVAACASCHGRVDGGRVGGPSPIVEPRERAGSPAIRFAKRTPLNNALDYEKGRGL
jgi:5-methylcytosine-specific restriction endonuclease McrA